MGGGAAPAKPFSSMDDFKRHHRQRSRRIATDDSGEQDQKLSADNRRPIADGIPPHRHWRREQPQVTSSAPTSRQRQAAHKTMDTPLRMGIEWVNLLLINLR